MHCIEYITRGSAVKVQMESNLLKKSPSALLKDLSKVLLESSMVLEAKKKEQKQEATDDENGKLVLYFIATY